MVNQPVDHLLAQPTFGDVLRRKKFFQPFNTRISRRER
jgi:hypothetical protein